jgi:hypothetical protein
MKSSFTGARVVQKDVVKLARKQVATVAAVSVPEGVTLEKMGKVRLETRATPQTLNVHSPDTPSSPAGPHPVADVAGETWITLGTVFFR